jgi:hypothetical protein
MANCPNCGSAHIQLKRETDVNWGRAVVGWAIFGVVGGAVGAVTGGDRNVNACLDCGTSWKAADLHKLLQIIKNLMNLRLDLSKESDRIFINDFISEFSSNLEYISNLEKQSQKQISDLQKKLSENANTGCGYGCGASILLPIMLSSAVASGAGAIIGLIMIALPIVGLIIGALLDESNKKSVEQGMENIKRETERKKFDAEENIRIKAINFMKKHPNINPGRS